MRKFIFYTAEGFTENSKLEAVDNCQILGWANGKDENDAFLSFKTENDYTESEDICCQELVSDKVYYF